MSESNAVEGHYLQDQCAMLLQSRIQALVDQLCGVSEMMRAGMVVEAFGSLDVHLLKCANAGQAALDEYADYHGQVPNEVYAESTVEFMRAVR